MNRINEVAKCYGESRQGVMSNKVEVIGDQILKNFAGFAKDFGFHPKGRVKKKTGRQKRLRRK